MPPHFRTIREIRKIRKIRTSLECLGFHPERSPPKAAEPKGTIREIRKIRTGGLGGTEGEEECAGRLRGA